MASCERCVNLSKEVERLNAQKKALKHLLNVVDASKKQKAQMVDQLLQLIKSKDEYYKKERTKIKEVAHKVKNITTESVLRNVPKQIDELSALYVNKIAEIKKYTKATEEARIAKQELETKSLELDGNKMYVKQLIADAEQVREENKTLSDSLSSVKQDLAKMLLKQKKIEKESSQLKDTHAYKLRVEAGVRKALDRLSSRDSNSTKSCKKILKNLMEFFSAEPLFTKPPGSSRLTETRKSLNSPHSISSGYSSASASPWSTPYNTPQQTEINTHFTCSFTPDGEFRLDPTMPQTNSQKNSSSSQGSFSSTSTLCTNPTPSTSKSQTCTKKLPLENPVTSWSMCDSSDDEIDESQVNDENKGQLSHIENKDNMSTTSQQARINFQECTVSEKNDRESEIFSHPKKNKMDSGKINTLPSNEEETTMTLSHESSNKNCTESESDSDDDEEELVENKTVASELSPVKILQLPDISISESSEQEQEHSTDQQNKMNESSLDVINKNSKQHFIGSENPTEKKNTSLFSPKMLLPDHSLLKSKKRKDTEQEITRAAKLLETSVSYEETLTRGNEMSSKSLPLSEMSDIRVSQAPNKEENNLMEKKNTPKKSLSDKNEVPTVEVNPKRKTTISKMVTTNLASIGISSKEEDNETVVTEDLNVSDSNSDCSENVVRTEEVMQIFKDMENMKNIDLISNFDPTSPCKNYRRSRLDSTSSNTELQKIASTTSESDKLVPKKINFVAENVEKTLQDIQSVVDHKIDLRKEILTQKKFENDKHNDAKQRKPIAMKDRTLNDEDDKPYHSLRRSTRSNMEKSSINTCSPAKILNQSTEANQKENKPSLKNKIKSISKKDSAEDLSLVSSKSTTSNHSLRRKSQSNVLPHTSKVHISNYSSQRRTRSSSNEDRTDADKASKEKKKILHDIQEQCVAEVMNKIVKECGSVTEDQINKEEKVTDNSSVSEELANDEKSTQNSEVIQKENRCRIGNKRKSSATDDTNKNPGFATAKSPLNCHSFRRRSTGNSPDMTSLANKRRTRRSVASVEMIDNVVDMPINSSKLKQELKQIFQNIDKTCVPKNHKKTKESDNHVKDQQCFAPLQSKCNDISTEVVPHQNYHSKDQQNLHGNQNIHNNNANIKKDQVVSLHDNARDEPEYAISQSKSSQCPTSEEKDNPVILEPSVAETTNCSQESESSVVNMSKADILITKSMDNRKLNIGSLDQNIPMIDSKNIINNPILSFSSVEHEEDSKVDNIGMKTRESLQSINIIHSSSENLITNNSVDECDVNNEIPSLGTQENHLTESNHKHKIVQEKTTITSLEPFQTNLPSIMAKNNYKPPNTVVNSKKVNVILRKMNFLKKFPFIDSIPATPPLKITKETGFKNFEGYNNPNVNQSEPKPLVSSAQEMLNTSLSQNVSDQLKKNTVNSISILVSSNNYSLPKEVVKEKRAHVSKRDDIEIMSIDEENTTRDTAILRENDLKIKNAQSLCKQLKTNDGVSCPSPFKNPNFCGPSSIISSIRSTQPSKSKFPKCIEEKLAVLAQNKKNLPIYAITPLTNLTHNRKNASNHNNTTVQALSPLTTGEKEIDAIEAKTNSQIHIGPNNMASEISNCDQQQRVSINNTIRSTINETVMRDNVTIQASARPDNDIILPTLSFYNSGNSYNKRKCEDTQSGVSDKKLKVDGDTSAVTTIQNSLPKKKNFKVIEHSIYSLEKKISKENEAPEIIKSSKITKKLNLIMHNKNRNMFDKNLKDAMKELETYPFDILSRRIIALLEKDMHFDHHKETATVQSQVCCIILKLMTNRPDFAPTFMKTLHETLCLHSETILLTNLYALLHVYVFLCKWRNDPTTLLTLLYDSIYFHKKRILNIFDAVLSKWPSVYPVQSTCILMRVMSALVLNQQTPQRYFNAEQCSVKTKQLLRGTYKYREQFTLVSLLEELIAMLKSGRSCCSSTARHSQKGVLNFQGQGMGDSGSSRSNCCIQKAIILLAKHWSPASDVHLVVLEKNLAALFRTSLDGGQLQVAASCAELMGMIAKAFPRASSLVPVLSVLDTLESGLAHPAALPSPPTRLAMGRAVACLASHNTDRCLDILAGGGWSDSQVSDLSAHVSALLLTAKDLDWWKAFLARAQCSAEVTAQQELFTGMPG